MGSVRGLGALNHTASMPRDRRRATHRGARVRSPVVCQRQREKPVRLLDASPERLDTHLWPGYQDRLLCRVLGALLEQRRAGRLSTLRCWDSLFDPASERPRRMRRVAAGRYTVQCVQEQPLMLHCPPKCLNQGVRELDLRYGQDTAEHPRSPVSRTRSRSL